MILGAIIGDVVGCPYEFNNIKTKKFNKTRKKSPTSIGGEMNCAKLLYFL